MQIEQLMWEPTDPDAWQGEVPPEWEPEECDHPRYTSAWLAWQDRLVFGDWFAEP